MAVWKWHGGGGDTGSLAAGAAGNRLRPAAAAPDATLTPGRPPRPTRASAGELVARWREATAAAREAPSEAVITITPAASPLRTAAFGDLLGGMRHDNAAALHDLLDAGHPGDPAALADGEWQALLEKWGRLDGPAAVRHLEETRTLPARSPGVLGGWAKVDPAAAAAWFASISRQSNGGPWLSIGCRELILGWLDVNAREAAAWLDANRDLPGYQEASARIAAAVFPLDRDKALARAGSLEGPWADWAYGEIERQWLAGSPDEARAAFANAGYVRELVDQIAAPEKSGIDLLQLPVDDPDAVTPWSGAEKWGIHISGTSHE